jgi:hypothetical protein
MDAILRMLFVVDEIRREIFGAEVGAGRLFLPGKLNTCGAFRDGKRHMTMTVMTVN